MFSVLREEHSLPFADMYSIRWAQMLTHSPNHLKLRVLRATYCDQVQVQISLTPTHRWCLPHHPPPACLVEQYQCPTETARPWVAT